MNAQESLREIDNLRLRFQMNNRLRLECLAALSKIFREHNENLQDELLSSLVFAIPCELPGERPAYQDLAGETMKAPEPPAGHPPPRPGQPPPGPTEPPPGVPPPGVPPPGVPPPGLPPPGSRSPLRPRSKKEPKAVRSASKAGRGQKTKAS
jgi:hypothetical protein